MTHVLIIGAGIIGAALAERLAATDHVTVVDEGPPGDGTTGTSLAWINANKTPDPDYFRFRVQAMRAWAETAARMGHPPWYVPTGDLAWARTPTARSELSTRVRHLKERGYAADLLTADEARAIEPHLAIPADALVAHFPDERHVHGARAARDFIARARRAKAHMVTGRVESLDIHAGRVRGARLADGAISADITVCAAGWRTPELLATADAVAPIQDPHRPGAPAVCLVATTTPAPGALRGLVHGTDLYARPTADGGLLLEAGDIDAAVDLDTPRSVLDSWADDLMARARAILPSALDHSRVAAVRRCIRPLPDDGLPVVGWVLPGLYTAVTHSGITLAPHLAALIAEELTSPTPAAPLEPYRPHRPGSPT